MPETEEEKQKRWAKNRAMAYMTPAMQHAMEMSKRQSQNKYKEQFNKTKGKGYTSVASTPEIDRVKQQSIRLSQSKYKSDFEKNKAKFTQVADDPETLRVKKVTQQVSKVAYEGRGAALAETKSRKSRVTTSPQKTKKPVTTATTNRESPKKTSYGRPAEDDVAVDEFTSAEDNAGRPAEEDDVAMDESTSAQDNGDYETQESESESHITQDNDGLTETEIPEKTQSMEYEGEEPHAVEEYASQEYENREVSYQEESYQETADDSHQELYQHDEESEPSGEREYVEADADEEGVKEYTEGSLDDFYAKLG